VVQRTIQKGRVKAEQSTKGFLGLQEEKSNGSVGKGKGRFNEKGLDSGGREGGALGPAQCRSGGNSTPTKWDRGAGLKSGTLVTARDNNQGYQVLDLA